MKKLLLATGLFCGVSVQVSAQVPPMMSTIPPQPAPIVHPDPLKTLQGISPQAFDAYYKDMVKASKEFGAEPTYSCGNSQDGVKYCGNFTLFNHDDRTVSLNDFVWQATGKHNQSVCLFVKLNEPNKICLRNDGLMFAANDKLTTKVYRSKW
jgi:hypothetical protein